MKLLVVEDDKALRKMVADMFTAQGYEVMTAVDGNDATRFLQSDQFDCVITDIFMPNKDGYEVIREIVGAANGTKIIAFSGMPETAEMGRDCLKIAAMLGAHRVLRKPFDFPQLLQAVDELS